MVKGLCSLAEVLKDAATVVLQYSKCGCIMSFISSGGYQTQFLQLGQSLKDAMQWSSFVCAMEVLAGTYTDDPAGLKQAICDAASMPLSEVERALQHLSVNQPGLLRALLKDHGTFTDNVVRQEVDALARQFNRLKCAVAEVNIGVAKVDIGVAEVKTLLQQLLDKSDRELNMGHNNPADYLGMWWNEAVGKFKRRIAWARFKHKLMEV
jgi:hypothetical protein